MTQHDDARIMDWLAEGEGHGRGPALEAALAAARSAFGVTFGVSSGASSTVKYDYLFGARSAH
jgi:hypothetical protein